MTTEPEADAVREDGTFETVRDLHGPLPSPVELAAYESIVPGAADRIIQMAEAEQKVRFALQEEMLRDTRKAMRAGQLAGLITFCVFAGSGVLLFRDGLIAPGYVMALAPLVAFLLSTIVKRVFNWGTDDSTSFESRR